MEKHEEAGPQPIKKSLEEKIAEFRTSIPQEEFKKLQIGDINFGPGIEIGG